MSSSVETVRLAQVQGYQFDVQFGGGLAALRADEPPPLGQGTGPSPVQLLAAAVGNCLSASLLFALAKFKQQPGLLATDVRAHVGRNAEGRLRVLAIEADITLGAPADTLDHLDRVLGSFENYCTVTQSVAAGIAVSTRVFDAHGNLLKSP